MTLIGLGLICAVAFAALRVREPRSGDDAVIELFFLLAAIGLGIAGVVR